MEKMSIYLNGIKSGCFVLLTCLSLAFATTSCNNDEFELNEPQQQKQYTKAELIEQALSRKPRTRNASESLGMVTINDTVRVKCYASDDMVIEWGDDSTTLIQRNNFATHTHVYTDNMPSHSISIMGTDEAIRNLIINNNGLIMLVTHLQKSLIYLNCTDNHLDQLDLLDCPKLTHLYATNNELSFVEISYLSDLFICRVDNNQLKEINVTKNTNLRTLNIENNKIQQLDLSKNTNLINLLVSFNPITALDLTQNTELMNISLENLSIKTINRVHISDTSFAVFPKLLQLNIAYTPFCALDLSKNPSLFGLNISGTAITRLDILDLQLQYLYATRSELKYLSYHNRSFENLYELRIERTPFEGKKGNIETIGERLPAREGMTPGYIYSYSKHINMLAKILAEKGKNWVINPS